MPAWGWLIVSILGLALCLVVGYVATVVAVFTHRDRR